MANLKSAKKRILQNEKKRLRNRVFRGSARNFIRQARLAIETGNLEEAQSATKVAVSALDKAAEKGVIHKNNASRRKGRIMHSLAVLEKGGKK
ncbi:MAG: 30S ribosomal protein S20 [Chloroflexota bacterium]